MRARSVMIAFPAAACIMVFSIAPAAAAQVAGPTPQAFDHAAGGPAARILDDVLSGDSCTTQPDNPSIKSTCLAVGSFADGPFVDGLMESSTNSQWFANIFGSLQTVTEPIEVSCVPQQFEIPTCVAVGEHFTNPNFPAQLVSVGDANGFSPIAFSNPKGTTWSVLDDVSCAAATSCLLVGSAGTTKRTSKGLVHVSHATAYRWNGHSLLRLSGPAPAHAKDAELGGVSCASATSCMAVGDYTSPRGRLIPYSALLTGRTWRVQLAKTVGRANTLFQGVSCAAAARCVAVGDADSARSATAFAERYAGGRWKVLRVVGERQSAFIGVSCPTVSYCVAAGQHGTRALIEAWNGVRWAVKSVPRTPAPLTTNGLLHVSCVSRTICTAVGFRHNPRSRFSFRTLALGWNGSKWTIQKTINE